MQVMSRMARSSSSQGEPNSKRRSDNDDIRATAAKFARNSTPSGLQGSQSESGGVVGPFHLARELVANRYAAKAAKDRRRREVTDGNAIDEDEEDLDEYEKQLRKLVWPPITADTPSAPTHAASSGTLFQPPAALTSMCVDILVREWHRVEDLGPLGDEMKSKLAYELSLHRLLTPSAVSIITATPAPNLVLPECSAISEESLIAAIERVGSGVNTVCKDSGAGNAALDDDDDDDDDDNVGLSGVFALTQVMGDAYVGMKLRVLRLNNCGDGFTNKTAGVCVKYADGFESLALGGCYRLDDGALCRLLSNCETLKELNLTCNSRLGSKGLEAIASIYTLEELTLDHCQQLTDEDMECLTTLAHLTKLSLAGLFIQDATLENILMGCGASLNTLILNECCYLTDTALGSIRKQCRALTHLGLAAIGSLSGEGLLGLFLNDQEIPTVGPLNTLELCNLSGMDDTVLIEVSRTCSNTLERLLLNQCVRVTGRGIMAIATNCSQSLCHLDMSFARNAEEQAIYALLKAGPTASPFTLVCWGCTQLSPQFYDAVSCCSRIVTIEGRFVNLK